MDFNYRIKKLIHHLPPRIITLVTIKQQKKISRKEKEIFSNQIDAVRDRDSSKRDTVTAIDNAIVGGVVLGPLGAAVGAVGAVAAKATGVL